MEYSGTYYGTSNPAYNWDWVNDGPSGEGYYDSSFGSKLLWWLLSIVSISRKWSFGFWLLHRNRQGDGVFTVASGLEPEFAENGGSGSGYYERIEGVGSYYGTSEPLFDFYDQQFLWRRFGILHGLISLWLISGPVMEQQLM